MTMLKNPRKSIIWNSHTQWVIFWLIISLLLKGSSTVWLAELFSGHYLYLNLALLIASYTLTFIPDIIVYVQSEKAELESTKTYVENFSESHKNLPQLTLDKQFRKKQEPWLANESRRVIRTVQAIIFGSISSISSILVDAITMSVVVNPLYVLGYIGSGILYFGSMKYFKSKIKALSVNALNNDKVLTNSLLSGWDNIVIGNKKGHQLWLERYRNIFTLSKSSAVSYVKLVKISGTLGTLIGSLPILGVTVWLFSQNTHSISTIALLLSILPRQLQTIQYFNTLSGTFAEWSGAKEKLNALMQSIEQPFAGYREPHYKIYWGNLTFFDSSNNALHFTSIENFLMEIADMPTGRVTIRGDNGSGKSVLLCKLKEYLIKHDKDAFYFPHNLRLCFSQPTDQMSSGEKLKAEINLILNNITSEKFILLDEWDANLDLENIQLISKQLDEAVKKLVIIEIRHRRDYPAEADLKLQTSSETPSHISFETSFD